MASNAALQRRWDRARLALLACLVVACDTAAPTEPALLTLAVDDGAVALAPGAVLGDAGAVTLRARVVNAGGRALGPIRIDGHVEDAVGGHTEALRVGFSPSRIATLNPGAEAEVEVRVSWLDPVAPGDYRLHLGASAAGVDAVSADVPFQVASPGSRRVGSVEVLLSGPLLQGEGVAAPVAVRDTLGGALRDEPVTWELIPADGAWVQHGVGFVPLRPGPLTVIARAGAAADTALLEVVPRRRRLQVDVVADAGFDRRYTSDLWVHGDAAWTGSWGTRETADGAQNGDMLYAWRVGSGTPLLTDSVRLDARVVNDVKVHPTRPLAVATHEGSNDGRNGVTLLDIGDPHHPTVITRYSSGLASGVHNAWLDGDHLYLVVDGRGGGLRILDVSDPSDPYTVASVYEGQSFLHDVLVRDGLAFLSQWNDGLVIVDVGHGIAGGSPTRPVEVSRLVLDGETHNAWYWPEKELVVVGEEDFGTPGRISLVDVSDLARPRRIGVWHVPGSTPHNVWLDEDEEILWAAWYGMGVQALDVSGTPMGVMEDTGRELASVRYAGSGGWCLGSITCSWAPQLHGGFVYVADMNRGLVVLRASEGS